MQEKLESTLPGESLNQSSIETPSPNSPEENEDLSALNEIRAIFDGMLNQESLMDFMISAEQLQQTRAQLLEAIEKEKSRFESEIQAIEEKISRLTNLREQAEQELQKASRFSFQRRWTLNSQIELFSIAIVEAQAEKEAFLNEVAKFEQPSGEAS